MDFRDLLQEFNLPLTNPVLIFSLILFIILISPILFRKFNIPAIIVLILAGMITGPFGFKILTKSSAVDLFSTIGLLYIMFIAGLELDMQEFKMNRHKSLLFGFFTFLIPIGIGFPVCYYLLDYDFNASILISGMFATHTLVAYPIVSKLGISKNQAVAITVGGTVLTDTAVLILLAVIMENARGMLNQEFWIRMAVSVFSFSSIMFFVVPRVARWFFRKMESEKHSHYIFVLSIVFLAAFLAEIAGLEPIIGAFAAGLALNKLIPHSSALMNRIEFIGNALFIPFFLISVGMLIDIRVIVGGPMAMVVACTLMLIALLGKWIAAFFTQHLFKYTRSQRQLIFGLSSSHAAATLAVILVGYNANILDETILNGTIILILGTCIVASVVTGKSAREIVVESLDERNDNEKIRDARFERILLPIANVSNIDQLLEFSTLIKDKSSKTPISILSVVSNDNEAEINIMKARNQLERFVKQASASEVNVNIITTIDHNPASGICRISKEIMADIIVLGWPQRSAFIDKLIGEKIDNILKNSNKTTLVCHLEKPFFMHKRIVMAVPPLAEHENKFELWFTKLALLAQELSIPVHLYCNDETKQAVGRLFRKLKLTASLNLHSFSDWEDFLILARNIHDDDLIVLASARKGATSYLGLLENLPSKLEKHFPENSKMVVYPGQFGALSPEQCYDMTAGNPSISIQKN